MSGSSGHVHGALLKMGSEWFKKKRTLIEAMIGLKEWNKRVTATS